MKITDKEQALLINIAENDFAPSNGGKPATFEECGEVWANCLDCGPNIIAPRSIPGIMASLVAKGLATTDGEGVRLTRAGFEAYKAI
jgi:hypothetical protein